MAEMFRVAILPQKFWPWVSRVIWNDNINMSRLNSTADFENSCTMENPIRSYLVGHNIPVTVLYAPCTFQECFQCDVASWRVSPEQIQFFWPLLGWEKKLWCHAVAVCVSDHLYVSHAFCESTLPSVLQKRTMVTKSDNPKDSPKATCHSTRISKYISSLFRNTQPWMKSWLWREFELLSLLLKFKQCLVPKWQKQLF